MAEEKNSNGSILQTALYEAEALAQLAFQRWRRAPTGPKADYWLTAWDKAQQNIVRLSRAMRMEGVKPKTLDEELADLSA